MKTENESDVIRKAVITYHEEELNVISKCLNLKKRVLYQYLSESDEVVTYTEEREGEGLSWLVMPEELD